MTDLDSGFSALSHPLRRDMMAKLADGRRTISDFAEGADMTFAAVSRHLKVLEEAGLVARSVEGREHYFAARPEGLDPSRDWIEQQSRLWQHSLETLKILMETDMTNNNPLVARAQVHIVAPIEKVFAAWLNPKTAAKFMGAEGSKVDGMVFDAKPGGELYIPMDMGERTVLHRGEFLRVEAPARLSFTWLSHYTKLRTTVVGVDFVAERGGTRVDLVHEGFVDAEAAEAHRGGWASILEQLKTSV